MPALAWTNACPAAPADYTGADPVVDELRDLRREQASACAAQRERVEKLLDGFGWSDASSIWLASPPANGPTGTLRGIANQIGTVTSSNTLLGQLGGSNSQIAQSVGARIQTLVDRLGDTATPGAGSTNKLLTDVNSKLAGTLTTSCASGCAGGGGGTVDTTDLELVTEESSEAVRATLWFLAGLVAVLIVAGIARREFRA